MLKFAKFEVAKKWLFFENNLKTINDNFVTNLRKNNFKNDFKNDFKNKFWSRFWSWIDFSRSCFWSRFWSRINFEVESTSKLFSDVGWPIGQWPYVQQPHAHDAPSPAMSVFLHKGPMCSSRTPTTPHPQPHPATATATTAATATGCDSQRQPATATAKATWSSGGQMPSNASNCPGTTRNVRLEYAEMSRVKLKYSRRGRHSDIILRTPSGNYKWGGGPEA